jgi:hypothetical protein
LSGPLGDRIKIAFERKSGRPRMQWRDEEQFKRGRYGPIGSCLEVDDDDDDDDDFDLSFLVRKKRT